MLTSVISSVSFGFGHIYWRNPQWKTSFFCAMISFPCSNIYDLHVKFFFTCHYTNCYFRTITIFAVDIVWNLDLIYSLWYYDIQWNEWQVVSKMTKVTLKEKNMKSSLQTISLRLNNPWINYLNHSLYKRNFVSECFSLRCKFFWYMKNITWVVQGI